MPIFARNSGSPCLMCRIPKTTSGAWLFAFIMFFEDRGFLRLVMRYQFRTFVTERIQLQTGQKQPHPNSETQCLSPDGRMPVVQDMPGTHAGEYKGAGNQGAGDDMAVAQHGGGVENGLIKARQLGVAVAQDIAGGCLLPGVGGNDEKG